MIQISISVLQEINNSQENNLIVDDIPEIDDNKTNEINTNFTAYLAENNSSANGENQRQRAPFYCKELGFAMEKIPDGYTLKDLWEIIPSK